MSTYTTELRNVIKMFGRETVEGWFKAYELSDYLTAEEVQVIETRGTWTKEKLAKKIVDHYFMREIGFETPMLFAHQAKVKMAEIMESKLPYIYSQAIKYDPLINVDFTESYTSTGKTDSTSNSTSSGLTVNSDTPQGQISKSEVLAGRYASATSAGENNSDIADETNTSQDYTKTVKGNSGVSATAQKMVEQYRDNIVTIDKDIIYELDQLFMGVF